MIIELPKSFTMDGETETKIAYIEDGMLKLKLNASFRKVMTEMSYEMKGSKKCCYCNRIVSKDDITIDHIFPQDTGGPTITNNLLPSCKKCNNDKANMTWKQYKKFLILKEKNSKKKYIRDIKKRVEKTKIKKRYQIPQQWLSEIEISKIIASFDLNDDYKGKKYNKIETFYLKYHYLPKPIVVDKNYFLLDGFISLMFAKNYKIRSVPVIVLENVQIIL